MAGKAEGKCWLGRSRCCSSWMGRVGLLSPHRRGQHSREQTGVARLTVWCSYSSWGTGSGMPMDDDMYASEMRRGMAARAGAAQKPSAAAAASWQNLRHRGKRKPEPQAASEAQERQQRAEAWAEEIRAKARRAGEAKAGRPEAPSGKRPNTMPEVSSGDPNCTSDPTSPWPF